ncbi:hypothetical protein [Spirosoma endbachense]|uniref:Uncharacterized protein n=1 Tax=Spirosoma endbachense TaxID=2666025 RepID=A0A6P1VR45_9BACT|nr:hypothetical protein [Spirosoma endbachense]QHV94187.1 hypothetical protein GJR95_03705 [Spirosoma endbachense]
MKKLQSTFAILTSVCLFVLIAHSALAQFSVGINGSVASSDVEGSETFYGGGLNAKIFPTSNFAIGLGIKAFGESRKFSAAGQTLEYSAGIIPITALVDYYFTDGFLRPYVGAEVGVYAVASSIKFNGQESSKVNSTNGGVAPKIGLLLAIGNLGIFAEGAYNIIFGNKDGNANVGGLNNVNFDKTSKFFTVNVGLQIGIPGGK